MKNALRCCISCILPCGALDVIRIVHSNGRVEELTKTVRAAEVMKAHPKHVLKKPSTSSSAAASSSVPHRSGPAIVVVPPEAQLQRGKIYFLIPVAPTPPPTSSSKKHQGRSASSSPSVSSSSSTVRRKRRENSNTTTSGTRKRSESGSGCNKSISVRANLVFSDQYLSEILNEKISTQRERRRGRVAVWRPHLESICESLPDQVA